MVDRLLTEYHRRLDRRGGKWTVPAGGGLSKVIPIGDQHLKLGVDAYYNAVRPKADQETWLIQFTATS